MDGILLFDKPRGWTSHDAVDFIRRKISQKKVGHAGTLDPLATGLLVLLLGQATKWSDELMGHDKEYQGLFRLGIATDTYDLEGKVLKEAPFDNISTTDIEKCFSKFQGEMEQTAPAYSALKKQGRKLYELARAGVDVEAPVRRILIREFFMTSYQSPDIGFRLACSKGTYVRSLANDIGVQLGCGATLAALERTASGRFLLANAWQRSALETADAAQIEKSLLSR